LDIADDGIISCSPANRFSQIEPDTVEGPGELARFVNLVPGRLYRVSLSGFGVQDAGDFPSTWAVATASAAGAVRRVLARGDICGFAQATVASRCDIAVSAVFRTTGDERIVHIVNSGGAVTTFLGADRVSIEELNDFQTDDQAFVTP
jgi:hypothetical protein